jgi:hypothetical protein
VTQTQATRRQAAVVNEKLFHCLKCHLRALAVCFKVHSLCLLDETYMFWIKNDVIYKTVPLLPILGNPAKQMTPPRRPIPHKQFNNPCYLEKLWIEFCNSKVVSYRGPYGVVVYIG